MNERRCTKNTHTHTHTHAPPSPYPPSEQSGVSDDPRPRHDAAPQPPRVYSTPLAALWDVGEGRWRVFATDNSSRRVERGELSCRRRLCILATV